MFMFFWLGMSLPFVYELDRTYTVSNVYLGTRFPANVPHSLPASAHWAQHLPRGNLVPRYPTDTVLISDSVFKMLHFSLNFCFSPNREFIDLKTASTFFLACGRRIGALSRKWRAYHISLSANKFWISVGSSPQTWQIVNRWFFIKIQGRAKNPCMFELSLLTSAQ